MNQGCQIFLGQNVPKREKYKKRPQTTPNGHKIYQHFPFKGPPKYTQIGIFGLKVGKPTGAPVMNTSKTTFRKARKTYCNDMD
jgi:hypothetical protein